ncbi:toxin-antitoxin system protein, partial [Bacteroides caecigallinarum]|nr:toxin-antitoxin system protein [Bacteroides caecigallinarum]
MLYRVDKRKFQVGDIIMPNTSFEELMQDEKKEMEDLLNEKRPRNIPERKQCLFLFQDLICAFRFYSKYG